MTPARSHSAAPPARARRAAAPAAAAGGSDPASLFSRLADYVGFTKRDSSLLASFHPKVQPHLDGILDDFYARIEADPLARGVITGGDQQVARLKSTLRVWLDRTLKGPHDAEYAGLQSAIGTRHVQVGLDQSYMVAGMQVFREHLNRVLFRAYPRRTPHSVAVQRAFVRILDLSLALMLETYREDWARKMLQSEQNSTFRRLAAIGEVAAVIAHEIRNPLTAISSAIQVIGQEMRPDEPRKEILGEILNEVRRLDGKVNDLLIYARPSLPARELVDPLKLIRTTVRLISDEPRFKNIRIVVRGPRDLPAFPMDPGQIQQVIVNLVLNATQAMNRSGEIRIAARRLEGGGLEMSVEDTGPGVPQEIAEEIFRPFFTTRAGGTGLGLAISRKIVESHGGALHLGRAPGGGARLVITLPVPA